MALDQELFILGLLKEGPKHGYEIKGKIKKIMEIFGGSGNESIYYPLKVMEKKGLVTKRISRMGNRPQRNTYGLSQKGEKRFSELLNQSLTVIDRPQFNIDASLYFLPFISQLNFKHKLLVRVRILKKILSGLLSLRKSDKIKPFHHCAIINHNIELINAEINFLTGLTKLNNNLYSKKDSINDFKYTHTFIS